MFDMSKLDVVVVYKLMLHWPLDTVSDGCGVCSRAFNRINTEFGISIEHLRGIEEMLVFC